MLLNICFFVLGVNAVIKFDRIVLEEGTVLLWMSWNIVVTALDKATGMSSQQDRQQRPNRRSGANNSSNMPPRQMTQSVAAQFGIPTNAADIDPAPEYKGPRNRTASEAERAAEEEEEMAREEEEARAATAAGANPEGNQSRQGTTSERTNTGGGTDSRTSQRFYEEYSDEDTPRSEPKHSQLLEQLSIGLRNHLDNDIAETYYREIVNAPQYQKDELLAILLTMLGNQFMASQPNRPPPGPETTTADPTPQLDKVLERLDGLEIRVLSLQKTVGHSSTDPLSQQPGPSVGFGGNLPFGMPAANPNLATAFSMYGSKATTMQGTQADPGVPTESQQEILDRLTKMGL
uniref:Putative phosphoprotein n=1 Tax=Soybean cyst nematode nyami-like virus TaxID=2107712 RepID=A0A2P1CXV1_9MONO|nr:putative phosphoprotein [Soybean cyst nematode nyami-like virus]